MKAKKELQVANRKLKQQNQLLNKSLSDMTQKYRNEQEINVTLNHALNDMSQANQKLEHQLNSLEQGLHNLYTCFKDADPINEWRDTVCYDIPPIPYTEFMDTEGQLLVTTAMGLFPTDVDPSIRPDAVDGQVRWSGRGKLGYPAADAIYTTGMSFANLEINRYRNNAYLVFPSWLYKQENPDPPRPGTTRSGLTWCYDTCRYTSSWEYRDLKYRPLSENAWKRLTARLLRIAHHHQTLIVMGCRMSDIFKDIPRMSERD